MKDSGAGARGGVVRRSLLEAIGDTPLVELRRTVDEAQGRVFAKLECVNPTGTKDDRVARQILEDARNEGRLGRCQTVVAATDGVMALALAQSCAVLRHPLTVVLSRGDAHVPLAALEAFGAEVVFVDQHPASLPGRVSPEDWQRCCAEVEAIQCVTGAFDAAVLHNPSAFRAHRLGTGEEILRQAAGEFGAFVDFVATGALLGGCTEAFQAFDPTIRCYAVEPTGAAALSGEDVVLADHGIEGGGLGLPRTELPHLSHPHVELAGVVQVTRQEAHAAMVDLARREGIFTGLSTGANLAAARKLLDGPCFGETIVIVVHDNGIRRGRGRATMELRAAS